MSKSHPKDDKQEGSIIPSGVRWLEEEQAYNFVLYSTAAALVALLLYEDAQQLKPLYTFTFDRFRNKTGPIWHCRLSKVEIQGAKYYAYQVAGPRNPDVDAITPNDFDAHKILLDPYAKSVFFPPGFEREAARAPGPNAGRAPLGVIEENEPFNWGAHKHPRRARNMIIYEMHVKGFTRNPNSGVAKARRGTFAGVIEKIPYLQALGVTAVELMPVFQFDPQEGNYWGYMPLNFFAPHNEFAASRTPQAQRHEFREMVKALHAADIEVLLDVVYNHTCEGDQHGPTYSFRGIDARSYYIKSNDKDTPYANFSGCGNTLDASNLIVRRLVMESLRYWREEMGVDGFRFDLASVFSRNTDGTINEAFPGIFSHLAVETCLQEGRLIAEPWDAGGANQLGRGFPGWLWQQWNGLYRDTIQRFMRGEDGLVPELMTRLYGSSDLFPDDAYHACRPWQSINYVTSHDGSTLYDLVSYERKNNWANGQNNTDGCTEYTWNCGWEGEGGAPVEVQRLRVRQVKNFCTLLMLSNGTPMFRMGDEFMQTQGGNNNAYNQDNTTSWLDWRRLEAHREMFRFFKLMISFRKAHPTLSRTTFWRDDIHWYGHQGPVDWSPACRILAFCLRGASQGDGDLYVMINGAAEPLSFRIQEGAADDWFRVVDTALPSPGDIVEDPGMKGVSSRSYLVQEHAVVVLWRALAP